MGVLYESMADCVRRCADVYAQLSENVGWRGYEELSDENGVSDNKACKYNMIRWQLLLFSMICEKEEWDSKGHGGDSKRIRHEEKEKKDGSIQDRTGDLL